MWPFKKKEPSDCPPEAVCAYEFNGTLYKTPTELDQAKRRADYEKRAGQLGNALAGYSGMSNVKVFIEAWDGDMHPRELWTVKRWLLRYHREIKGVCEYIEKHNLGDKR